MVINNLLLLTALAWTMGTLLVVMYFLLVVEKLEPYTGTDLEWAYSPSARSEDPYPVYPAYLAPDYAFSPTLALSSQPHPTTISRAHALDQTGRLVLDIASV